MRTFFALILLIGMSCTEIEQPEPCAAVMRDYTELRSSLAGYIDEWIQLSRYELKIPSLGEWLSLDPERRYERLKVMMDENSECLDFR